MRKIKELEAEVNELKNRLKEIEEYFIKRNKPICYVEVLQDFRGMNRKWICWKDKEGLKINKIITYGKTDKIATANKGEIFVSIENQWFVINKIKNELEKVHILFGEDNLKTIWEDPFDRFNREKEKFEKSYKKC